MSLYKIKTRCLFAISLFTVVYSAEDVKATTEASFSEVLGNISRVNDLIQDLIMNYKQLKKMTKSDLESDYDLDKQTDLFQEDNKKIRNGPREKVSVSSKHGGLVTAMFFSDDETDGLEIGEQNEGVKTKHRLKNKQAKKQKGNKRNKPKPGADAIYSPIYDNNAGIIKPSTLGHIVPGKKLLKEDAGLLKKEKSGNPALDTLRDLMKSLSEPLMKGKVKTRENALQTVSNPSFVITPITMFPKPVTTFNLQLASTPSKKHLEPRLEIYDLPRSKRHNRQWSGLRKTLENGEIIKKTEVLDTKVSKKPKREHSHRKTTKKTKTQEIKRHPESENVLRDEIQTNALRKAYGDACLRLVLRKCYMACKGVVKETCHGRRICTKQFRATFKKKAIRGCDIEFNNNTANFRVANTQTANEDEGFVDLTRDGYLAMACLPSNHSKPVDQPKPKLAAREKIRLVARHKMKPIARQRTKPERIDNAHTSLNILRDRYEKACQQESAMKCFKACKYATNEACKEETCKTRKKDAMVKACKKRCKQAYGAGSYSDSDDSDSSTSESKSRSRKKSKEEWRRI